MRLLLLMRHAKAVADAGEDDHARPLAKRGHVEAVETGHAIRRLARAPALLLASDARRTRETAEHVAAGLTPPLDLRLDPALYAASPATILARIRAVEDAVATLIVVGHNPGIGDLARSLVRDGRADDLEELRARFPTAALAAIAFDAPNWRAVAERVGRLDAFLVPGAG